MTHFGLAFGIIVTTVIGGAFLIDHNLSNSEPEKAPVATKTTSTTPEATALPPVDAPVTESERAKVAMADEPAVKAIATPPQKVPAAAPKAATKDTVIASNSKQSTRSAPSKAATSASPAASPPSLPSTAESAESAPSTASAPAPTPEPASPSPAPSPSPDKPASDPAASETK